MHQDLRVTNEMPNGICFCVRTEINQLTPAVFYKGLIKIAVKA